MPSGGPEKPEPGPEGEEWRDRQGGKGAGEDGPSGDSLSYRSRTTRPIS